MSIEVRLPQWGMGMQEGTVVRWFKHEGDVVEADEDLVEIEAAKTTQAVTAPVGGVLLRVLVPEGDTIPVRTPLAVLATASEAPPPPAATAASDTSAVPRAIEVDVAPARRVAVTPVARKLARDLGVDLEQVKGSGPAGRIDESDVRAFVARATSPVPTTEPEPEQEHASRLEPMSPMRRAIARNMHASLQAMAQLTLSTELDATELVRLRERLQRDFALTITDLIVYAAARALRRHPALNASLDGDQVRHHASIHIGLAVALDEGLIVPVIRDADGKSLLEIASETRHLAEQARSGTLRPGQVTGSTFSITNLGRWGIDAFTPIVNPPEAAILGVGRIVEKPAAYRGSVALRQMLTLSLTHDHQLVDGAPAAAFLQTLTDFLETPYFLGSGSTEPAKE
jgi:pyruvate dehydrogenase E2 component (dihydrolipoyllysine-residue acetyltransferase)